MGLFSSLKQTESTGRARLPAEEPVRRADFSAVPAGVGWHAIGLRGAEGAGMWPSFAVDFLAGCHEFKPLSEHLREYARYHSLEAEQVREVRHWAGEMIEAGLLMGVGKLVERCVASGRDAGTGARIERIAIPTAGDERRLRRVVGSFARNAREYGRNVEFTICSNGPAEGAGRTAALVGELVREEGVKVELMEDVAGYAERLARRAGVDPGIAAFALTDPLGAGFACGANRNALLLRNAGRPYLSVDDDVVCEMISAPEPVRQEGLVVFSSRDAFERWFYPEYGLAFKGQRGVESDCLGMHERMLGRSVSGFLAREEKLDFVGTSDGLARRLQETDGRIVTTFMGHFGHPGVPTSYYYLSYQRETLARLTGEGEEKYRAFLRSGGVCALVPRMAIADASLSPGMAIGIDARTLIPPFPPVMHAEDFVWGATVWQCCAAGFAGHLPVALRHDPGVGRGILAPPLEEGRAVAIWEFAHLLRGMVLGWVAPPGELETGARMESLGRHLCDLAGGGAGEFHEYLRWFVLQHESDKIGFLEGCLAEESGAPEFWRKDVEDYIEQTRRALLEPDFDVPFDMRKWGVPEARRLVQRLVLEYGRLLRAWPALVEAARND